MRGSSVVPAALVVAVTFLVGAAGPAEAATSELDRARARATAAAAELSEAETKVGEIEAQVAELEQKLAADRAQVTGLSAKVRDLALTEFMQGSGGGLSVFDADFRAGVRADALAGYVSGQTGNDLVHYRQVTKELEAVASELAQQQAAMAAAKADLERRNADAMAKVTRLERAEAARQAREAAARAKASRAEAAEQAGAEPTTTRPGRTALAASDVADDAGSAPETAAAPSASGSDFLCPVQGPVAFVDSFGAARSGGRRHQGVDMLSPRGTPIVANVSGTVRGHNSSLGGISYYLDGDDGTMYWGTHLSRLSGVSGHVEQGTVVGYVGDSGNARGTNHLHFEIHPGGGRAINPYPTVARYC